MGPPSWASVFTTLSFVSPYDAQTPPFSAPDPHSRIRSHVTQASDSFFFFHFFPSRENANTGARVLFFWGGWVLLGGFWDPDAFLKFHTLDLFFARAREGFALLSFVSRRRGLGVGVFFTP